MPFCLRDYSLKIVGLLATWEQANRHPFCSARKLSLQALLNAAHDVALAAGYKGNWLCVLENTSNLNFILNFAQLICYGPANVACVMPADRKGLLLHLGSCQGLLDPCCALKHSFTPSCQGHGRTDRKCKHNQIFWPLGTAGDFFQLFIPKIIWNNWGGVF